MYSAFARPSPQKTLPEVEESKAHSADTTAQEKTATQGTSDIGMRKFQKRPTTEAKETCYRGKTGRVSPSDTQLGASDRSGAEEREREREREREDHGSDGSRDVALAMKQLGEFNRAAEKEEDACALERTTTSSRRRRRTQLLAGEMGEEEAMMALVVEEAQRERPPSGGTSCKISHILTELYLHFPRSR